MALTDKEKHRAVYFLGWSGLTIVEDSTQYNSVVVDRLGTVAKPLNLDIERIVKGLLECLESIDERLKEALCRLTASQIDTITTNPDEIRMLRSERKRNIRLLSDHLDIPITASGGAHVGVVV